MSGPPATTERTILFISKATPSDDEFALWLAPRLEMAGYEVFADILSLDGGTRWRKEITHTLQTRAIKMLLCCSDETLAKDNVQEEVGIALDLAKELGDKKFLIPLRLKSYKKVLGIGELQYVDFVRGWAEGLAKLLETLKRQKVQGDKGSAIINPNWEKFRRRSAIPVINEPERLTSNWVRVAEGPDVVRYFEPSGAVGLEAMTHACRSAKFAAYPRERGFFAFGTSDEINEMLVSVGKFELKHEFDLLKFIREGARELHLESKDASNIITAMYRSAWNQYCRERGLRERVYSSRVSGFHAARSFAKKGQRIPWGRQGDRRSSMLRNEAQGHVWEFGVTGIPAFWPFHHLKLKSRVLFSPINATDTAEPYTEVKKQHRLRRSVCKGWRNKQWHGRLMAFLELLAGESAFISLPLSPTVALVLDPGPLLFSSPVSTMLPNMMSDEDEEQDESTLGRPEPDDEEDS
jgi:TIR domain